MLNEVEYCDYSTPYPYECSAGPFWGLYIWLFALPVIFGFTIKYLVGRILGFVSNTALSVTLTLTLSPQGRGDWTPPRITRGALE